jgi:hypothetical protein
VAHALPREVRRVLYTFPALLLLAAGTVGGCPVCESGTGQQVRAGIIDDDLGLNLLATLLPFSVVLGVVAAIHFGPPWRKQGNRTRGRRDGGDRGE